MMAQQTRIDTVLPYYKKWMERFPSLQSLANASEDEVLKTWEGLGYYARARNFHKAAQTVMRDMKGNIPQTTAELRSLPGIGAYTAAAIAAIAFNEDVLSIDANVRRVAARIFNLADPSGSSELDRAVSLNMKTVFPAGQAGNFNQALMDLGACICLPQKPQCLLCPVASFCQSFQAGNQEHRPIIPPKKEIPHIFVTAAVIPCQNHFLLAKRPRHGLLAGMWEYPGGKLKENETHAQGLQREIMEELGVEIQPAELVGEYRHTYTHYRVTLFAYHASIQQGEPQALSAQEIRWVLLNDLKLYPMGKIDRMISDTLLKDKK